MLLCIHLVVFFYFWLDRPGDIHLWQSSKILYCCCLLIVVVGGLLLLLIVDRLQPTRWRSHTDTFLGLFWLWLLVDCCCLLIVVVGWSLLLVDVDHCCCWSSSRDQMTVTHRHLPGSANRLNLEPQCNVKRCNLWDLRPTLHYFHVHWQGGFWWDLTVHAFQVEGAEKPEEILGRGFIEDKLCELGLGEVTISWGNNWYKGWGWVIRWVRTSRWLSAGATQKKQTIINIRGGWVIRWERPCEFQGRDVPGARK